MMMNEVSDQKAESLEILVKEEERETFENLFKELSVYRGKGNPLPYCALCFKTPSESNDLRRTGSHKSPDQFLRWIHGEMIDDDDASGCKKPSKEAYVYDPNPKNKDMQKSTKKVFAESYFLCQSREKKNVADCEKTVLKKFEDSLSAFYGQYYHFMEEGRNCGLQITHDEYLFGGILSILYRAQLDEIYLLPLSANLEQMKNVLWECRKALIHPQEKSPKITVFLYFPIVPSKNDISSELDLEKRGLLDLRRRVLRGSGTSCYFQVEDEILFVVALGGFLAFVTLTECNKLIGLFEKRKLLLLPKRAGEVGISSTTELFLEFENDILPKMMAVIKEKVVETLKYTSDTSKVTRSSKTVFAKQNIIHPDFKIASDGGDVKYDPEKWEIKCNFDVPSGKGVVFAKKDPRSHIQEKFVLFLLSPNSCLSWKFFKAQDTGGITFRVANERQANAYEGLEDSVKLFEMVYRQRMEGHKTKEGLLTELCKSLLD